ncbi:unnamed protein product [Mytilus edulis]|uniref:Chromo domain-containing protein n=1 Tax=Mytilus edulis TaxID=6550 RepID=A0A8S3RTW0_MYTED|nr:unnamed protein product [Mytilus edulis]
MGDKSDLQMPEKKSYSTIQGLEMSDFRGKLEANSTSKTLIKLDPDFIHVSSEALDVSTEADDLSDFLEVSSVSGQPLFSTSYNSSTAIDIKWQGYKEEENTWEPSDNIPNILINKFEKFGRCDISGDVIRSKIINGTRMIEVKWNLDNDKKSRENTWVSSSSVDLIDERDGIENPICNTSKGKKISCKNSCIFAQLGYTELNYYKDIVGQTSSIESCNCGAPETLHHFLLECPCYENEREDMLHQIFKEEFRTEFPNKFESIPAHFGQLEFRESLVRSLLDVGSLEKKHESFACTPSFNENSNRLRYRKEVEADTKITIENANQMMNNMGTVKLFDGHNIKEPMDPKTDFGENNLEQCCEKEELDDSETQKERTRLFKNILND